MAIAEKHRIQHPDISVDYDPKADVLYVSLGKPMPADGDFVQGIIYRLALSNGRPCGATIIGFRANKWDKKIKDLATKIASHLRIADEVVLKALRKMAIMPYLTCSNKEVRL